MSQPSVLLSFLGSQGIKAKAQTQSLKTKCQFWVGVISDVFIPGGTPASNTVSETLASVSWLLQETAYATHSALQSAV